MASPHYYMSKKNLEIFPLSGYSNSETINCRENGYYSIFKSDRYGFNNPDDEWDKSKIEDYTKQLKDLWNSREITILNNILLELEDNRKKNTVGLLDEQDALIRTLETILMRKEEKVSNILFENTTSLN